MFDELLSRDRGTGNPLVEDAACGAVQVFNQISGLTQDRRRGKKLKDAGTILVLFAGWPMFGMNQ
jgi:hypothetical protein